MGHTSYDITQQESHHMEKQNNVVTVWPQRYVNEEMKRREKQVRNLHCKFTENQWRASVYSQFSQTLKIRVFEVFDRTAVMESFAHQYRSWVFDKKSKKFSKLLEKLKRSQSQRKFFFSGTFSFAALNTLAMIMFLLKLLNLMKIRISYIELRQFGLTNPIGPPQFQKSDLVNVILIQSDQNRMPVIDNYDSQIQILL